MRQLRYVCEVARLGSIQAASRSLSISQSSILAAIGLAEGEMGAALFDRRPARGVLITPAGERFVKAARVMIAAESEFARSIGELAQRVPKVLRIGCFEPFGALFMPELLRRYVDEVGQTDIVLLESDQSQLGEQLASGAIDLAVLYDIGPSISDSVTPICRVPVHAVLSAGDPLAKKPALWIGELAERPLVLLDLPRTVTYLLTLFDVLAKRPEVRFRTRSYETVRSAVAAGFGVSVLNMRPIGSATADGAGIVRRPILDDLPPPTLLLADMYGPNKPLFVRTFIDVCRRFFASVGPAAFSVTVAERHPTLLVR